MTLIAAADGSALGNPGPAGWAWYVDDDCWAAGGWPHGTNNMGELTAVLDLLRQTAGLDDDLLVYCDSTYAIKSITQWLPGWKRHGWRKRDGKPVQNVEIMQALDEAMQGRRVRFEWVKGHAGHRLNEAADRRANAAAVAFQQGREPDPGPGFRPGPPGPPGPPEQPERPGRPERPERPDAAAVEPAGAQDAPDLFSFAAEPADGAAAAGQPTDEQRVVEAERALLSAAVRSDPAAVAALLHPQWHGVDGSGRRRTREHRLAEVAPLEPEVRLDVVSVERLTADVVLLVWRAVSDTAATLHASLWLRADGSWRQRFHQGTREQ